MSSTTTLTELDQRILAGYRAGATLPQLCLAEGSDPCTADAQC